MPYAASPTVATIIGAVEREFKGNVQFAKLALVNQDYYDLINEAMDEMYGDTGFQPDIHTISTIVDQYEYPIDGSANNFPAEVDEIIRVDYDGAPLKFRFLYPEQIIEPSSDDIYSSSSGWYEKTDDGKRNLGLTFYPSEVVDLTIYTTRISVVVDATSDVPAVERDFFSLVKYIVVAKLARRIKDYELRNDIINSEIIPGKIRLAGVYKKRTGKNFDRITVPAPRDFMR